MCLYQGEQLWKAVEREMGSGVKELRRNKTSTMQTFKKLFNTGIAGINPLGAAI